MTVIVAVKKNQTITIASDTFVHFGQRKEHSSNLRDRKLYKIGNAWMGTSGWVLYDNILQDILSTHPEIHLGNKSEIFHFFMNFWKELHENYSFVKDQVEEEESPFGDLDSSFLTINPSGIYSIASDMSVVRYEQYTCIGSGADYALGCLHALFNTSLSSEQLATRAVETASHFNIYCGGEIDLATIQAEV